MKKISKRSQSSSLSKDLSKDLPHVDPIEGHMAGIITSLGEDLGREGLQDTPKRYARAMRFLTSGYAMDIDKIVGKALFTSDASEMVIVRDIELFSLCEHHLVPFYGRAHVGYLPKGKVIGLSKIPRIVDVYSRRLQIQERLTQEIAKTLQKVLKPEGVAVVIESYHMCMMMRGVQKQNSKTVTSCMLGEFRENSDTRKEFLQLLNRPE